MKEDPKVNPIYPSVDPTNLNITPYKPPEGKKGAVENPFERNSITNVNNNMQNTGSPTISQILRDFK